MLSRQFTTVPNTSKVRAFTSDSGIVWVPSLLSGGWCNRQAANDTVALDQPRHEPRFLCFFDKVAQKCSAHSVFPWRANRLLHGGELPIENARAGTRLGDVR